MKTLLSTTALVIGMSFPALAPAQITGASSPESAPEQGTNRGFDFLGHPGIPNLFVSELIGQPVLARRAHDDAARAGGQPTGGQLADGQEATAQPADGTATDQAGGAQTQVDPVAGDLGGDAFSSVASDGSTSMHLMGEEDLAELNQIGYISEVVLTGEGQLLAIVVDTSEYFGVPGREVSLAMEQVTFSHNPDDIEQLHIVLTAGPELLEEAPEFDRVVMRNVGSDPQRAEPVARHSATPDRGETRDARSPFEAPRMEREGFEQLDLAQVSTERLMGSTVYDVNDEDVGTVQDIILGEDGTVARLIIDFGGFLGIGSSQAALEFGEVTALTTGALDEVRLYVNATREQIENLPPYQGG